MLTGQTAPFLSNQTNLRIKVPEYLPVKEKSIFNRGGLDFNQLNELLLAYGYDRISAAFFNIFLCPSRHRNRIKNWDIDTPCRIPSMKSFKKQIELFRIFAMLKYANFKFAFKKLSKLKSDEIREEQKELFPISADKFQKRPVPLIDLEKVPRDNTYLLGLIAGDDAKKLEDKNKKGVSLTKAERDLLSQRTATVKKGLRNYYKYLSDDFLDVYVATSMRRKEDFTAVYDFVKEVFSHPLIKDLKLRYFDPTQADPQDRLAKGLIEGLMVKRAQCTIYCAQESDTFGKDSELAATLAQGKPVIAFIPQVRRLDFYKAGLLKQASMADSKNPGRYLHELLIERHPRCILENPGINDPRRKIGELSDELAQRDKRLYEKRAKTLHEFHPLSLQINLQTGVSNGVLVVRNSNECAKVLRGIILKSLKFEISELKSDGGTQNYVLKEKITGSIYRVVSGDPVLTNSFWNFYL